MPVGISNVFYAPETISAVAKAVSARKTKRCDAYANGGSLIGDSVPLWAGAGAARRGPHLVRRVLHGVGLLVARELQVHCVQRSQRPLAAVPSLHRRPVRDKYSACAIDLWRCQSMCCICWPHPESFDHAQSSWRGCLDKCVCNAKSGHRFGGC